VNSVNSEAIKADYQNGVLTMSLPKREEAKRKQIKVTVGTHAVGTKVMAAAAGAQSANQTRNIWAGGRN
jgi:hypothetical protein